MPAASLTPDHRARLLRVGVTEEILDDLDLYDASDQLPAWFAEQGNTLYLGRGLVFPEWLTARLTVYPFADGLVVLASPLQTLLSLLLGGDGATVFVGAGCELTAGQLYCGAGSSIVLHGKVVATGEAMVDARNGGSVVAEWDQLWAARVYIATDDMHSLVDVATGVRFNPYGAHIRLGRHVWLGREAIVTGHVEIGESCVVGLRSLVRGQKVPPNTAVAGTPARVIREGITWDGEDRAPLLP
jgi:acetyltransferase-like isoleucine patch superfamily enzyme